MALAFGNSQPAGEMIVAAFKESPYDTGIDLDVELGERELSAPLPWDVIDAGVRKGYLKALHDWIYDRKHVYDAKFIGGRLKSLVDEYRKDKAAA